uniref:Uncharacterized protein n=1 Tax=Nelumbo nucifera TaxID=4432 RepID=A0A822XAV1_NELNU|nr:TPA_asm: hypothetical protein HUJ06_020007 [Nelumbo nucifera]
MSFVSSLLPFLIICFTVHACKARHFQVVDKESDAQDHLSGKDLRAGQQVKVPENKSHHSGGGASCSSYQRRPKQDPDHQALINNVNGKPGKASGGARNNSLVSVSWRVPHHYQKHGKHPGFDIDYTPPKTRPPSHN